MGLEEQKEKTEEKKEMNSVQKAFQMRDIL